MLIVPLQPVPLQALTVSLSSQACQVEVSQQRYGLFLSLFVNNAVVVRNVKCLDRCRIVRDGYFQFAGDLAFVDQQGVLDPSYAGLGGRFALLYLTPDEVEEAV